VQTYSLNEDGAATLRRKGTLRIVGWSPLLLASLLVLLWLTKESAELGVPKTLIVALLLGVGASIGEWFVWVDQVRKYKLLVDADAICMIGRGSAYSVLRGQVRTTWEKRDGLYVSEKTGILARMGGYVWIPRELPEFAALKDLVTSWKMPSNN
jgi:hypothetical protein